jgi:hypothetical protein
MIGDAAYDSGELREHERGTKPVIPNRCNRKLPFTFNNCAADLLNWRRVGLEVSRAGSFAKRGRH